MLYITEFLFIYHSIISKRFKHSSLQPMIPYSCSSFVRVQSQTILLTCFLLLHFFLKLKMYCYYFFSCIKFYKYTIKLVKTKSLETKRKFHLQGSFEKEKSVKRPFTRFFTFHTSQNVAFLNRIFYKIFHLKHKYQKIKSQHNIGLFTNFFILKIEI